MGTGNAMPGEAGAPGRAAEATGPRSRVVRLERAAWRWDGVPLREYKRPDASWAHVTRQVLVGERGETCSFQLRYFEVAPGGHTTLERHCHEHAVVVVRGEGEVELGGAAQPLAFGDVVWVAPGEPHRFRARGSEPFGFLCAVDAVRDRPEPLPEPAR
jgi:ribulose-bisphosphate carboxylase large chain